MARDVRRARWRERKRRLAAWYARPVGGLVALVAVVGVVALAVVVIESGSAELDDPFDLVEAWRFGPAPDVPRRLIPEGASIGVEQAGARVAVVWEARGCADEPSVDVAPGAGVTRVLVDARDGGGCDSIAVLWRLDLTLAPGVASTLVEARRVD